VLEYIRYKQYGHVRRMNKKGYLEFVDAGNNNWNGSTEKDGKEKKKNSDKERCKNIRYSLV